MKTPKECPKCKSRKVQVIVFGTFPEGFLKKNEFAGGTRLTGFKWHCAACGWEWSPNGAGRYNK
jgi:rubredoxin